MCQTLNSVLHLRRIFHVYNIKHYLILNIQQGFPSGSDSKESAHNVGSLGSIPGSGSPSNTLDQPGLVPGTLPWLESNEALALAT